MEWSGRGGPRPSAAPARAHLIGATAPGMPGVAQVLVQSGASVAGSTSTFSPAVARLRRMGVRVHPAESISQRLRDAHFVVYPPGTAHTHAERLVATRRRIAQWSPLEWLPHGVPGRLGLAVLGDRGAAVAAAMIAWVLTRAGLDPTVVLTQASRQLGGWGRFGRGPHLVVDASSTGARLRGLNPQVAVLLGLGDSPSALDSSRSWPALAELVESIPTDGYALVFDPADGLPETAWGTQPRVEVLSLQRRDGWWGADLREERGRYRFRAFHGGRFVIEVGLLVPGRRNVICALAAIAACGRVDLPAAAIREGLEEFTGLSRDFESRGSYRGVTLLDDDSGDAGTIGETLDVVRQVFGERRVWAVCGGDARETACWDSDREVSAFRSADRVLIVGGGGESCPLASGAGASMAGVLQVDTLDEAISELDRRLEPGDVLVTLGAGAVGTIADAFLRRLPRDRQGG